MTSMTPRQWVTGIVALVVNLALAFLAGRFSAPEKVVEKVEWKERAAEKGTTKKAKATSRIVYVDRVVTPQGEVREKRTMRTVTDAREVADVERLTERGGKSESTTPARPDWRVGVLVGASLREPLVPIAGPLVLGASVERRILGPFSVGAWVNTVGAAGASVSGEF